MSGCRNRLAYHLRGKTIKFLISCHNWNWSSKIFFKLGKQFWWSQRKNCNPYSCSSNGFIPFCLFANTHMNSLLRPFKLIPFSCSAIIMKQKYREIPWKLFEITDISMYTSQRNERERERDDLFHSCINITFLIITDSEGHKVPWLWG